MAATLDDVLKELQAMRKGGSSLSSTSGSAISSLGADDPTWMQVGGAIFNGFKKGVSMVGGAAKDIYGTGIAQESGYSREEAFGGRQALDIISSLSPAKALNALYEQGLNQLQNEAKLRVKINEQTGLTGKLSEDVRNSIINASPAVLQLGYGVEQLGDFYTEMIEKSGRFNILNKEALIRTAEVSRAFVGDLKLMADYMNNFQNIGLGAMDAADAIEEAGVKSLSLGLRSKTTVKEISENLDKLNAYGFKNGIAGLARMSQLSSEFRMNMNEVFKVADKVFSPEGAIELSANLQVIGGILGDFNDPLKLMYMATNNVEGLQTAMIEAAKSLATYNNEQGRFEITGVNLRKAKAMAQELGISYDELAKGAISAAERSSAASALFSTGIQMKDDDREFLTNLSQMEGGQMVIKVPESISEKITGMKGETTLQLNEMTDEMAKGLLENKKAFEKMDSRSIAMEQLTLQEKIERNVMAIAATAKISLSRSLKENFETMDLNTKLQSLAGLTGKSAEELTASGGVDLTNFLNKTIMSIRDTFTKGDVNEIMKSNKAVIDSLKEREDKSTAERKQIIENRHIHEYNASPTLLDNLGRFIARSPQTWEEMYSANTPGPKSFIYTGGRNNE